MNKRSFLIKFSGEFDSKENIYIFSYQNRFYKFADKERIGKDSYYIFQQYGFSTNLVKHPETKIFKMEVNPGNKS